MYCILGRIQRRAEALRAVIQIIWSILVKEV